MKRRDFLRSAGFLALPLPFIPIGGNQIPAPLPLPFATAPPLTNTNPSQSRLPSGPTLYLGVAAPHSGVQATLAQQLTNGVRQAIADVTRLSGIIDRPFDVQLFDDTGNVNEASIAANFAVGSSGVICVIGHLGNAMTDAALETYARGKMPLLIPTATSDVVTSHGYRNIFRLATRDSLEGDLSARYALQTIKPHRVAVITHEHGYGQEVGAAFASRCRYAHIDVQELRLLDTSNDPTPLLAPLSQAPTDLIVLSGTADQLGLALRSIRGLNYQGPIIASQGFFDMGTISTFGRLVEGLLVSTSMPPIGQMPSAATVTASFSATYGDFTPIAAFGYTAAQIAMSAIQSSGAVDRLTLNNALSSGSTYHTLLGDFSFSPFGDPNDPNIFFYRVQNGAWRYAAAAHSPPFSIVN